MHRGGYSRPIKRWLLVYMCRASRMHNDGDSRSIHQNNFPLTGQTMMGLFFATSCKAREANASTGMGRILFHISRICCGFTLSRVFPNLPPPLRSGVSTTPGHKAVTFTPCRDASTRSDLQSPTIACFVDAYAVQPGSGVSPATEAVLMMWPDFCFIMIS